uniref:Uncharacterized protein n=1 Tax=Timema monikensis TaxID=170555 RepID=A0A7R9DYG1_9NEOP|nr:unnamed protein product [Timema monikensis]
MKVECVAQKEGIYAQFLAYPVREQLAQLCLCISSSFNFPDGVRPAGSIPRRQQLDLLDEGELFMELIRDVANELDIDVLCHKILVNVGVLTSADRGSLFLARGPREHRYLIAKLFDVTVDTGEIYTGCHLWGKLHGYYWETTFPFSYFYVVNLFSNIRQVSQRWFIEVASSFLSPHYNTFKHN